MMSLPISIPRMIIGLLCSIAGVSSAATMKVAALVPPGTVWADNFKKMSKEVAKETNGKLKMKLFLGGVAGDEPDVQRKIRVGQLHGGIFTGKALGDIYPDFRLLEVPFTFGDDRQKALATLDKMEPFFTKGFREKGMVALGFYEVGKVYVVSRRPVTSIADLSGTKIWAWEGDPLVAAMFDRLKFVSVPLGLPDVLPSLSTGVIEAAYASPLGIVALQWQSRVKYLIDFPITYSFGAFLVSQKFWNKLSPEVQKTMTRLADKYKDLSNQQIDQENRQALELMKQDGIQFTKFPATDVATGKTIREQVLQELSKDLFSKEAVAAYRTAAEG